MMFSGNIKRPMTEFTEGINTYKVEPIILSNKDADEIIKTLRQKVDVGEALTKADLLPLCLSPLMGGEMTHKERIVAAYDITRRVTGVDEEVIKKVEAVIYIMADKFLQSSEMKKLREEIKMTRLGQMLYNDWKEEGERLHLLMLVRKKLEKGKTLEVIADEVESDVETIEVLNEEMSGM